MLHFQIHLGICVLLARRRPPAALECGDPPWLFESDGIGEKAIENKSRGRVMKVARMGVAAMRKVTGGIALGEALPSFD